MHNETNKVLNTIAPIVREALKEQVGNKIFKKDGTLTKAFCQKISPLLENKKYKVNGFNGGNATISNLYLSGLYRSLTLNFKVCFSGGSYENKTYYCEYIEKSFNMGDINDRVLVELKDYKPRIHISEEQEIYFYEKARALTEELEQTKNKIKLYEVKRL